jgi:Rrf2 family protein
MIKINRKVEYALMVLKLMQDKGPLDLTSAREVGEKFGAPFDTVSKVMQLMNSHGLLISHKGVKGGYLLSKDLSEVTYLDLVKIIEGKNLMMDCHEGPCEMFSQCNIIMPIKRLNDYLLTIFQSLSLSELLAEDNLLALKNRTQTKIEDCPVMKGSL